MTDSKVSKRYATSLLDNSVGNKKLEVVARDMELILDTIQQNSSLVKMLSNPVIKSEIKFSVLQEIFQNKVSSDSMSFLNFVIQKNREIVLKDILKKFIELKNEYFGIVEIEITTALEFSKEQFEELKNTFEQRLNKKVQFIFTIDSSIIGGFIAKVKDTLYDASVRHQLEILKKQLLQGGVSLN